MEINEAVKIAVDYVRKTNKKTPIAVRHLWGSKIRLSDKALEQLAQESLSSRVGCLLNQGSNAYEPDTDQKKDVVGVYIDGETRTTSAITTIIDVLYATPDGEMKPLINFTLVDFSSYIDKQTSKRDGIDRRIEAAKYGRSRLEALGAKSVAKLPRAEQEKFAARWDKATGNGHKAKKTAA